MLTVFLDLEYWQGACTLLTLQYKKEIGRFRNLEDVTRFKSGTSKIKFKKPKTYNHGNKNKMGNRSRTHRNFF